MSDAREADTQAVLALLREVRDDQRAGLALAREQLDLARAQHTRAQQLNDRAAQLQDRSAAIITTARRTLAVVLPLIFALIGYLTFLLLR